MLSQLIYVVRLLLSFAIVAVGVVMLIAAAASAKQDAASIGVPVAMAVAGALAWPRRPNAWRRDPPTERQLEYAKDLGIPLRKGMTKGEVSDLISEFKNAL